MVVNFERGGKKGLIAMSLVKIEKDCSREGRVNQFTARMGNLKTVLHSKQKCSATKVRDELQSADCITPDDAMGI